MFRPAIAGASPIWNKRHVVCVSARLTSSVMKSPTSFVRLGFSQQANLHIRVYSRLNDFSYPKNSNKLSRPVYHHIAPAMMMTSTTTTAAAMSYYSSRAGPPGRRPPPPWFNSPRLAQGAGMLGGAAVLLGKGKYLLGALKLTKFASLGSMVVTIGTYSMFFGLPYAAGIVGLTLVHEAGHALVMVQRGIPFSPMVFLPFMGAVIAMNRMPRDAWEDSLVAFGGPVLGSIGAGAVAVGAHATGSQLLFALADFGFMVNLFNLLPLGSMDGGRIGNALSPYAGVAGLGMGGMLAYSGTIQNPLFYLIFLAGGYETFMRFYDPGRLPPNYYKISGMQRAALTGGYFGLVTVLLVAMDANQRYRKPPEVLMREQQEKSWNMTDY